MGEGRGGGAGMILSTGKPVEVNCNILGIDGNYRMFGGCDEEVTGEGCSYYLTAQEKREVAAEIKRRAETLIELIDSGRVEDDIDEYA
jgi:hypothetical protein